uniref:Uncharacterized protein n=1 Tax=Panagrolaimus sp. PS1159 TaxID=55785 RepID=A0AC35FEB3_9BILA
MSAEALWYHHFKKICLSLARARVKPIETNDVQQRLSLSKQLLTYNGKQMVFTLAEEREMYFNELNNRWN